MVNINLKGKKHNLKNNVIGIIGLGYVGLPLAVAFGKIFKTIGFDINNKRIEQLKKGKDSTNEISSKEIYNSKNLFLTNKLSQVKAANIFIITVPTPVKKNNSPDLKIIQNATRMVASILKKNDIIIFESTVYPGLSEELALSIVEKKTKLKLNKDFFIGYSPERINPGDKNHKIGDILKVTSGSNKQTSKKIDRLYKSIISAGTYRTSSIKVAEAAKVIENTQRDLNIALVNELAIIFDKMEIDTHEVLDAAKTKWNFLPFEPGLVGGHCIGVDPYYLTHKSQKFGYKPNIILAGRKINDGFAKYVYNKLNLKIKKNFPQKNENKNVLIMGFSFKENVPDIRNTKVIDIIRNLKRNNYKVDVFDPIVDKKEVKNIFGIDLIKYPKKNNYVGIVIAVKHKEFIKMKINKINLFRKKNGIIFDVKNIISSKYKYIIRL
tara:strand:+ start:1597 stop:2907 length:1311 start_codon:yes stop_codon:yes gene_type:complete